MEEHEEVALNIGSSADWVYIDQEIYDDHSDIRCTSQVHVRHLRVKSYIQARFATTLVTSRLANPSDEAKEVTFTAQLPDAAFISNFTMQIGDKIIVGDVKEKEEAKVAYDQAKQRGESAGLVAQKPRETNSFTISTNIAAHDKVTFNLTYQEILKRVHGAYKHIINLQSDNLDKSSDIEIDVRIVEQGKIANVSVPKFGEKIGEKTNAELLTAEQEPNAVVSSVTADSVSTTQIRYKPKPEVLQSSNGTLGGQLVVLYDVERDSSGGQIQVVNGYFVHFFAPQGLPKGQKHVVFVLDKSGSMMGRKFAQTQEAMKRILKDLHPNDIFNIIMFSTEFKRWKQESVQATPANVQEAVDYVMGSRADYSTNIYDPLVDALEILKSSKANPLASMVIFMTDGQPNAGSISSPNEIVTSITNLNNETKYIIHSIAFGRDADFDLVQRISTDNYGLARKVYEDSDADMQLTGFYAEISSPLLTEVKIDYLNETVDVSSLVQEQSYNYYDGGEFVVLGRLNDHAPRVATFDASINARGANGPVALRSEAQSFVCPQEPIITDDDDTEPCCTYPRCGSTFGRRRIRPLTTPRPLPGPSTVGGFVERMWAYQTIKKLLKEAKLGGQVNVTEKREEALRLSLKYHFVTEMTSMVVVQPDANATSLALQQEQKDSSDRVYSASRVYSAPHFALLGGGSGGHMALGSPAGPPGLRSQMPGRISHKHLIVAPPVFTSTMLPPHSSSPTPCDEEILVVLVPGPSGQLGALSQVEQAVDSARTAPGTKNIRVNTILISSNSSQSDFIWGSNVSWQTNVPTGVVVKTEIENAFKAGAINGPVYQSIAEALWRISRAPLCSKRTLIWVAVSSDAYKEAKEYLIKEGFKVPGP